jgi:hypothetical protein
MISGTDSCRKSLCEMTLRLPGFHFLRDYRILCGVYLLSRQDRLRLEMKRVHFGALADRKLFYLGDTPDRHERSDLHVFDVSSLP